MVGAVGVSGGSVSQDEDRDQTFLRSMHLRVNKFQICHPY